jgi:NADPH:quinone reductase-like Zn-dependent oxidoreductase
VFKKTGGAVRVYRWRQFGDLAGLKLETAEGVRPGPHEVRLRVRASSLNHRDLLVARGVPLGGPLPLGLVPLSDGAGEVLEVGAQVTRFRAGDRVIATFRQGWIDGEVRAEQVSGDLGGLRDGMLADEVVLSEEGLVSQPAHLEFDEAATLPCAAVTAWNAVIVKGGVKPGDTVLVQGTGGVAIFALQFAKLAGAEVLATTSSPAKAARLAELGADATVDRHVHADWDAEVLRLTGGRGVDLTVELGGAGTINRSLAATRIGGRLCIVGLLSAPTEETASMFMTAFMRNVTIASVHTGCRTSFEAMNRAIVQARLRPVIGARFGFEDAPEALRFLAAGGHIGKVVIRHDA